jgi:electron transfer flavoprotein alpha subunit
MSIKVLAIAEQKNGKISNVSYELITAAAACGGEMFTACLAERADNLAADLCQDYYGIDQKISTAVGGWGGNLFRKGSFCPIGGNK